MTHLASPPPCRPPCNPSADLFLGRRREVDGRATCSGSIVVAPSLHPLVVVDFCRDKVGQSEVAALLHSSGSSLLWLLSSCSLPARDTSKASSEAQLGELSMCADQGVSIWGCRPSMYAARYRIAKQRQERSRVFDGASGMGRALTAPLADHPLARPVPTESIRTSSYWLARPYDTLTRHGPALFEQRRCSRRLFLHAALLTPATSSRRRVASSASCGPHTSIPQCHATFRGRKEVTSSPARPHAASEGRRVYSPPTRPTSVLSHCSNAQEWAD